MTVTIVKEIVEDFLTVPGIAGLGLMDGQSATYFCNVDGAFVLQEDKSPLLQNVTQVLMTIPPEYQTIAWQWQTYQAYLHRIDSVQLLMVLAHSSLNLPDYQAALSAFTQVLQTTPIEAIAALDTLVSPTPGGSTPTSSKLRVSSVSVPEMLQVCNYVSRLASIYLDHSIVASELLLSRPPSPWLETWQISDQAQLLWPQNQPLPNVLSVEQHHELQDWMQEFIQATAQIIRHFNHLLDCQLSAIEKQHLFHR